jgi:hypothetical protein
MTLKRLNVISIAPREIPDSDPCNTVIEFGDSNDNITFDYTLGNPQLIIEDCTGAYVRIKLGEIDRLIESLLLSKRILQEDC